MKKFLLIVLFSLFFTNASANDATIRARALNAPNNVATSTHKLAKYLTKPYKDDYDKLKVIAYWIASHIAYDEYKFKDGKENHKEMSYQYDILKMRAGICSDFARLFMDMANASGVRGVEAVDGYVLENQHNLKKQYKKRDMPEYGHAWNKVKLDKRSFYVDTTFMANGAISPSRQYASSLRHKLDLKQNARQHNVNENIDDFFFDFTPKQEVKQYNMVHVRYKYIK